jgi:hypothetical protein
MENRDFVRTACRVIINQRTISNQNCYVRDLQMTKARGPEGWLKLVSQTDSVSSDGFALSGSSACYHSDQTVDETHVMIP